MNKKLNYLLLVLVLLSGCSQKSEHDPIQKFSPEKQTVETNTLNDNENVNENPKEENYKVPFESETNQKNDSNQKVNMDSDISNDSSKPLKPQKPVEPDQPVHSHEWKVVYRTIHHDEVGHDENVLVKEAWDEEVPVYEKVFVMICNECDHVMRNAEELDAHFKGNYDCGSWRDANITEQTGTEIIHHDAIYENKYVIDKESYDEQVIDYYLCDCGKTKN